MKIRPVLQHGRRLLGRERRTKALVYRLMKSPWEVNFTVDKKEVGEGYAILSLAAQAVVVEIVTFMGPNWTMSMGNKFDRMSEDACRALLELGELYVGLDGSFDADAATQGVKKWVFSDNFRAKLKGCSALGLEVFSYTYTAWLTK